MAKTKRVKRRSRRNPVRDPSLDLEAALRALKSGSTPAPAPVSAASPSRTLRLDLDPGETDDGMRAKTALRPTLRAAQTVAAFDNSFGELDLTSLVGRLADQVQAVQRGELGRAEEMLVAQAHTLDMLFHQLVHRSASNSREGYLDAAETYMRLALRSQSQARATLETLSVIKNPPSMAFVRQANIANIQQVNNGTAAESPASRAREIPQSQLLEQQQNERVDVGTAQAPSRGDPAVAPVGTIDGTADTGG